MKMILPKHLDQYSERENKNLKRGLIELSKAIDKNDLPRKNEILKKHNLVIENK